MTGRLALRIRWLAAVAFGLGAVGHADVLPDDRTDVLYHRYDGGGLTVRVTTHGCTKKADFAHFAEPKGQTTTIAFARKRLDRCGQRAGQLDLLFSYAELGLAKDQPVMVLNPVVR